MDDDERVPCPPIEPIEWKLNEFSIYVEDFTQPHPHLTPDNPFRNYHPFPKWDAAEKRVRSAATEARERVTGAWRVLRGDRDPFDVEGWG